MTPISDDRPLVERLEYVVGNPSAWPEGFNDNISELIREAVQSLRAQGGVRVKGLEWHGDSGQGSGFKYVIAEPSRTPGWRVWAYLTNLGMNAMATSIGGHIVTMKAENRDAAKAAAQADYERRILSSLEASPAPVSEAAATSARFARLYGICRRIL